MNPSTTNDMSPCTLSNVQIRKPNTGMIKSLCLTAFNRLSPLYKIFPLTFFRNKDPFSIVRRLSFPAFVKSYFSSSILPTEAVFSGPAVLGFQGQKLTITYSLYAKERHAVPMVVLQLWVSNDANFSLFLL